MYRANGLLNPSEDNGETSELLGTQKEGRVKKLSKELNDAMINKIFHFFLRKYCWVEEKKTFISFFSLAGKQ